MLALHERLYQSVLHVQVQFEVADATKRSFGEGSFDVVYSRDTILHISDKKSLFSSFLVRMLLFIIFLERFIEVILTQHTKFQAILAFVCKPA